MNARLILVMIVVLGSTVSPTPHVWHPGVKKCWTSNRLCPTCSDARWNCIPEKGVGPRRCVKFRFDGESKIHRDCDRVIDKVFYPDNITMTSTETADGCRRFTVRKNGLTRKGNYCLCDRDLCNDGQVPMI